MVEQDLKTTTRTRDEWLEILRRGTKPQRVAESSHDGLTGTVVTDELAPCRPHPSRIGNAGEDHVDLCPTSAERSLNTLLQSRTDEGGAEYVLAAGKEVIWPPDGRPRRFPEAAAAWDELVLRYPDPITLHEVCRPYVARPLPVMLHG